MSSETALVPIPSDHILVPLAGVEAVLAAVRDPALREAVDSWLRATTDATSPRYADLLRDKARPVAEFFELVGRPPDQVMVNDVKAYHALLESRGLEQATIYALLSRLSSFYKWLGNLDAFRGHLTNPVAAARPRAPSPYQSDSTKSLTDDQVMALVTAIRERAASDDVVGKRDYAMFVTYLLTGLRRSEVARLRWGDLHLTDHTSTITVRLKGGHIITREVDDRVPEAILDYLQAAGRLARMRPEAPLWISHDRAKLHPDEPLTGHAFAKNLKRYAQIAGIGPVHIHQTRHTYARIVADQTGSLIETQDALGHANAATTRVYVQRVGVKKDKHGDQVARRLGL